MRRARASRLLQVRAGHDVAAAITELDQAATMDLGLPQYFRGSARTGLLPSAGPSEEDGGRSRDGRELARVSPTPQ